MTTVPVTGTAEIPDPIITVAEKAAMLAAIADLETRVAALEGGEPEPPPEGVPDIHPDDLVFTQVAGPTRYIDAFNDRFVIEPRNEFTTGQPSDIFDDYVVNGTSSVAYSNGAVFTGALAGCSALRSRVQPLAPYAFAEITVTEHNNLVSAFTGFARNAQHYCWAYVTPTHVGLDSRINNSQGATNVPVVAVVPYTLRLVLCYPEIHAYLSDVNGDRWVAKRVVNQNTDLRSLTEFSNGWKPLFGMDRLAGGSGKVSSFRSSYTGAIGLRDFKPLTHLDGKPYRVGSKVFFLSTCATGHDFKTNHTSVLSVDVDTYAARLESLLFFNIASTDPTNGTANKDKRTSLYGGQALWDGSKWRIIVNGWGYGNVSTGIKLWYAETTEDICSEDRVLSLDARQLVLPTANSVYDNAQYFDGTNWHVALAETEVPSGWTGGSYHTRLFSGPDLDNLVLGPTDLNVVAEGINYARIGGAWYVTSGGTDGPHRWEDGLADYATPAITTDPNGTNIPWSGYGSHLPIVPIDRPNDATQYMALMFDDSKVGGQSATKGALVIQTSQVVPGSEF